jgi:hypothetical protein
MASSGRGASDTPDARATSGLAEDPVNEYLEKAEPAQPTGSWTGTMPGAIEPLPVNQQAVREYWERVARAATSTVEREHAEHEAQEAQRRITVQCVVPSLKGDSLARARRALLHAHCKLGKVSRRDDSRRTRGSRREPRSSVVRPRRSGGRSPRCAGSPRHAQRTADTRGWRRCREAPAR